MKMPTPEPGKEERIADMKDFMPKGCVINYDIDRLDKMNFLLHRQALDFTETTKAVCSTILSKLLKHWWNSPIVTISYGRENKVRTLSECSTTCVRQIITFRTEQDTVGNAMMIVC